LQWGRGFSTAEMSCGVARTASGVLASMGPRFLNRGNVLWRGQDCIGCARFNGAAVSQPRKCPVAWPGLHRVCALQWGRGFSTAEMSAGTLRARIAFEAAKEPRVVHAG